MRQGSATVALHGKDHAVVVALMVKIFYIFLIWFSLVLLIH